MLLKLNGEINIELEDVNEYNDSEGYIHLECILKNPDEIDSSILEKEYQELYIDDNKYENLIFYAYCTKDDKDIMCFSDNREWYDTDLTVDELFEIHNELMSLREVLTNKHMPGRNNENLQKLTYKTIDSSRVNKLAGYTMLCRDWIDDFANWIGDRKVLEVGAGIGALAKQLRDRNIDITAIDDRSWDRFSWQYNDDLLWTEVLEENYLTNAIKYRDCDLIILSYPVQGEFAGIALELMRVFNSDCRMVFIGPFREDYADEKFITNAVIITDDEDFNTISDKYMYWIGQPYMKSQLLYLK